MRNRFIFSLMIVCLFSYSALAKEYSEPRAIKETLKVGLSQIEPIIFKKNGHYKGLMVDLWEQVSDELNINYEYIELEGFDEVFDALKNKHIDIAINGLYFTSEREKLIDYTVPTFNTGQQILVKSNVSMLNRILHIIFSETLLYALLIFCGFIIFAAHMIWLLERGHNPAFSKHYREGILESIWWTTVTLTTVGYGDKIPIRVAGKFFAIFWMLMGYFVLAYFTASITSILTVSHMDSTIQSLNDLKGKKVATASGAIVESLKKYKLNLKVFKQVDEMYFELESGKVDAIILDSPIIKYYAINKGKNKVAVVGDLFNEEFWGFALQQHSPYKEVLNLELMRLYETGFIKKLNDKWFEGINTF